MSDWSEQQKADLTMVVLLVGAVLLLGATLTIVRFKDLLERQVVAQEKIAEGCQNGLLDSVSK